MTSEIKASDPVQYAAFRLRFRALVLDAAYCLGLFVVGGLVTGILFESRPAGRVALFLVILAVILAYEPFMVARYAGTFGHRKNNIRVICAQSDDNLPFWRAAVRSLVKGIFGVPSFLFMFVTSRAQGLHDLLSGARVVVHYPLVAGEGDFFKPELPRAGQAPTGFRRLVVTAIWNVLLLLLLSIAHAFVSSTCLDHRICTSSESSLVSILTAVWVVLAGLSIVLGWTGRLPGCRPAQSH